MTSFGSCFVFLVAACVVAVALMRTASRDDSSATDLVCRRCGQRNPGHARFCRACGLRLIGGDPPGAYQP